MRAGSGFTPAQQARLEKACETAAAGSGFSFGLAVGPGAGGDLREEGERALARLADGRQVGAVLVVVDPGGRRLEILTTATARRRLTDSQCALAALSMTTSFGVGDVVGGLVNGLRMLADGAAAPEHATPQVGRARS